MSLFQCENCGCAENTALSYQGIGDIELIQRWFDWRGIEDRRGKMLCSACAPARQYRSTALTGVGVWHGKFARVFLPMGEFRTNHEGNLEHIKTGRTDYLSFVIDRPAGQEKSRVEEKRITTENILGEFGFCVRWTVQNYWADVEVFGIEEVDDETNTPLFYSLDSDEPPVESIDEAEHYLSGFVKWDGCSELNMGTPHWCGVDDFKKHCALLEYIYKRSFELMGRAPEEAW